MVWREDGEARRVVVPICALLAMLVVTSCQPLYIWQGNTDGTRIAMLGDSISNARWAGAEIASVFETDHLYLNVSNGGARTDEEAGLLPIFDQDGPEAPEIVYVNLGTNDVRQATNGTWDLHDTAAAYQSILAYFPNATCFLLVTVGEWTADAAYNSLAHGFNSALRYVASIDPRIRIVDWSAAIAQNWGGTPLTEEGIHPNQAGQDLLAQLVADALASCPAAAG